jgi:hypothetical protein
MTSQKTQALSYKRGLGTDLLVLVAIIVGRGLGRRIDSLCLAAVVTNHLNLIGNSINFFLIKNIRID